MDSILNALSGASGVTIASAVAVGILAITALLMPVGDRRQLRLPIGFFIAHLVMHGVELLLAQGSAIQKAVSLIGLGALLICIGRTSVLLVIDVILGRRLERQLPKIIRDIIQGVVYFVLTLALLRQLGLEPGQLLTTSALLTAVIGLSLQDTLGNLIAGLSVQIQRPFNVGDWIQFDNDPKNIGRIMEINWRATTLLTLDEIEVVVPNGALAKAPLRVFSRPSRVVRRNIFFQTSYEAEPKRVHQVVLEGHPRHAGRAQPPPNIVTDQVRGLGHRILAAHLHRAVPAARRDRRRRARSHLVRAEAQRHLDPFPHRVIAHADPLGRGRARATRREGARARARLEGHRLPQGAGRGPPARSGRSSPRRGSSRRARSSCARRRERPSCS
ncbi:MAG: mechanosensitive ion channel family protein [Polyangiaceae bacterium]|nr:mechanosensitive ion channel family protein [Polyangiaceae bacterium]